MFRHGIAKSVAYARARWLFGRAGVACEGHPQIYGPSLTLDPRGEITIGRGFVARGRQFRSQLGAAPTGRLELGEGVFVNQGCFLFAACRLSVGDYTRFADLCFAFDTNFHTVSPQDELIVAPVIIGRNVWVGAKTTILPGAQIGDHSVIGSGSVVTGEIPPRAVAAGNPARVKRVFECSDDWIRS